MAIHPSFPTSPYAELDPNFRWFPADEALRDSAYDKLIPPLVHKVRKEVKTWRDHDYQGVTETARALLTWWFQTEHLVPQADGTILHSRHIIPRNLDNLI